MAFAQPSISEFVAWPVSRGRVRLTWRNNGLDFLTARVERDDGTGEFSEIGKVAGAESFLDAKAPTGNQQRTIRYRLRLDGTDEIVGPAFLGVERPSQLADELNVRHNLFVQAHGIPVAYFSVKATPTSCECYDVYLRKSKNPDCPECAGSGNKTGYAAPVLEFMMDINPDPNVVRQTEIGQLAQNFNAFWTSCMNVIAKPNDVFVTSFAKRYRVISSNASGIRGFGVLQRMQCVELAPGGAEYDLTIPDELLAQMRDPARRALATA